MELNDWVKEIVEWRIAKGFVTDWAHFVEKVMLIVTECAEAVEAHRDDNLFSIPGLPLNDYVGSELADVAIRLFDLAGSLGYDLEVEIRHKMAINYGRPTKHGKAY